MCLSCRSSAHLDTKFLGAKFHGTHRAIPDQLDKANVFVPGQLWQAMLGIYKD